jgi:hypothetical protein
MGFKSGHPLEWRSFNTVGITASINSEGVFQAAGRRNQDATGRRKSHRLHCKFSQFSGDESGLAASIMDRSPTPESAYFAIQSVNLARGQGLDIQEVSGAGRLSARSTVTQPFGSGKRCG